MSMYIIPGMVRAGRVGLRVEHLSSWTSMLDGDNNLILFLYLRGGQTVTLKGQEATSFFAWLEENVKELT